MGQRTATTDVDGSYRFLALPPGTYALKFELAGFQTVNREGVVVTSGVTFTIDSDLQLATVAETITVTGESPVVDVKQTGVSTTFDTKELQEVPSATDMWAVLQQTPGVRMAGFDVGGSHKSQQTSYDAFGVQLQNIIRNEGVNNTEATCCTGGYYDFYAITSTASAPRARTSRCRAPALTWYRLSRAGAMSSRASRTSTSRPGAWSPTTSMTISEPAPGTSAPVNSFKEFHIDLGGPVVKDKFWFYGAYNYFKIDKTISSVSPDLATDVGIFNEYTSEDQLADLGKGPVHRLRPLEPEREALPGSLPDDSRRVHPGSGQLERNLQGGVAEGLVRSSCSAPSSSDTSACSGRWCRPSIQRRIRPESISPLATAEGGGLAAFRLRAHEAPEQWSVELLRAPGLGEPRLQVRIRIDASIATATATTLPRAAFRYRDSSALGPVQPLRAGSARTRERDPVLQRADVPGRPEHAHGHLRSGHLGPERSPDADSRACATAARTCITSPLARPRSSPTSSIQSRSTGASVKTFNTIAPRLGATFDLTGNGKSVFKAFYGRYYANAGTLTLAVNPIGNSFVRYQFLDPNNNGIYDGQQELGNFITGGGGAAGQTIADDFDPAYVDEFSFSVENELKADTGVRFSYVRKQLRNSWATAGSPYYPAVNLSRATENITQNVDMAMSRLPARLRKHDSSPANASARSAGQRYQDRASARGHGRQLQHHPVRGQSALQPGLLPERHLRLPVAPRAALAECHRDQPALDRSHPVPVGSRVQPGRQRCPGHHVLDVQDAGALRSGARDRHRGHAANAEWIQLGSG